uniref:hypothetical protein n=1 Tax=Amycolatopsis sp. CA-096443 TaxID=3239919 RepID=UPI003F498319
MAEPIPGFARKKPGTPDPIVGVTGEAVAFAARGSGTLTATLVDCYQDCGGVCVVRHGDGAEEALDIENLLLPAPGPTRVGSSPVGPVGGRAAPRTGRTVRARRKRRADGGKAGLGRPSTRARPRATGRASTTRRKRTTSAAPEAAVTRPTTRASLRPARKRR